MVMHRALHSHVKYVAVAMEYLVDEDGEDIISSHVWSMIKAGQPAIDGEGRSLVSGLSDQKAADLDDAIEDYEELFKTLYEEAGYPKEMIQVGVAFTTQSFIEEMQYLRECPRDTLSGSPSESRTIANNREQSRTQCRYPAFRDKHRLENAAKTSPGVKP